MEQEKLYVFAEVIELFGKSQDIQIALRSKTPKEALEKMLEIIKE